MKKISKKVIPVVLVLALVFSFIPFWSISSEAATTLKASVVANYFNGRVGSSYPDGWCLAFVADGFQALGATRSSANTASIYGDSHIMSTSMSNIPVGADVFYYGGLIIDGRDAGHIGVYVGNGNVVHAYGGNVKKYSLSQMNTIWRYRGWGYHGNVTIIDDLSNPIVFSVNATNPNTQHVVFSWNAVPDAVSYNLRVDSNGDGSAESDVSVWGITGTTYSKLLPVGSYSVWLDAINSSGNCFLTNRDYRPSFKVVQGDYLPQKTLTYNKHVYSIYNEMMTWKEAKAICETMGGHLATVTSVGEQQMIENLITGGTKAFYHIGGTDEVTEGAFKWVTGETFSYTNWDTGQPNNYDGVQDYMMVYNQTSNFGKWNDIASRHQDNMSVFGFICEIEPVGTPVASIIYNGSKYSLYDNNMTWKDAKAMCETLGGHLVTITSAGEQQAINQLLANGKKSFYTTGASDDVTEGAFKWVTGESFSYTNWGSSQPDNWAGIEDYSMLYNSSSLVGKWNDVANKHDQAYGFICEILTAPTFTTAPSAPTSGNVTVNITYPALATVKEYKIGTGAWIPYTAGIALTSNNTVYARCSDGPGYYSPTSSRVVTNIDRTAPLTPNFTLSPATPTAGNVTVTINYPADATDKEYKIGLSGWGKYTGPFEMDANNTVYARCGDTAGNISNTGSVNVTNIVKPPVTPANFKAVRYSSTSIKLTWSPVAGASGYVLYKYNASTKTYARLKTLTATSYINIGLTKGVTYYYKVRAYRTVSGVNIYGNLSGTASAKTY